jgi:ribosome-associated translation inhibitor RaiA
MKIEIHTDAHTDGSTARRDQVSAMLEQWLGRFREHLTRLDAHLSDENGSKPGGGPAGAQRCLLEAHVEGRQPMSVSHQAAQMAQAVRGAADKLTRLLDSRLERLHGYPRGTADGHGADAAGHEKPTA